MSAIVGKLRFTFDVSPREFNLIRRALESFGGKDAALLSTNLLRLQQGAIEDIKQRFEATLAISTTQEGDES